MPHHQLNRKKQPIHTSQSQPPPKRSTPRNKPSHLPPSSHVNSISSQNQNADSIASPSSGPTYNIPHDCQHNTHTYHHQLPSSSQQTPMPLKAHSASPLPNRMGLGGGHVSIHVAPRTRRNPNNTIPPYSRNNKNRGKSYFVSIFENNLFFFVFHSPHTLPGDDTLRVKLYTQFFFTLKLK